MKKTISLIGINSKFIHTNLAIRYLKSYCQSEINEISIIELSINDHFDDALRKLYLNCGNILAFSCYIWNIEYVLKLCSSIRKLKKDIIIILGGPEVSFDSDEIMKKNPYINYIIRDEGEKTFLELSNYLNGTSTKADEINGLTYRENDAIISNPSRELISNLDEIPFPYENLEDLKNKIIYYETIRGCPFNCQYCLSSTISGVRFFSLDRVKNDLDIFIENGVNQVKLVDRTFNCKKEHAINIIKHIITKKAKTNFHFEISADLLDDEFIDLLNSAPLDMFQLEIGVQSTNLNTLTEIRRNTNLGRLYENIKSLLKQNNMHIHLDLIAGLPYEDFKSFGESFNDVYLLKPHMLQLGFLKLLKGSGIRSKAKQYSIEFNSHTPYEILKSEWINHDEILILKDVEKLLENYYNSGKFKNSLNYIIESYYNNPFDFYNQFALFWNQKTYFDRPRPLNDLYIILSEYVSANHRKDLVFEELLRYDFISNNKNGSIPSTIIKNYTNEYREKIHLFLKDHDKLQKYLPNYSNMNIKDILKQMNYEIFKIDVTDPNLVLKETLIIFDYGLKKNDQVKTLKLDINIIQ